MAVSRDNLKLISSLRTAADVGWMEQYKTRIRKGPNVWKTGGSTTYTVHDETEKEVRVVPRHGANGLVIEEGRVRFPGRIFVEGGPESIHPGPGLVMNPEGVFASTFFNPTPAFLRIPGPLDGVLGSITDLLGGALNA